MNKALKWGAAIVMVVWLLGSGLTAMSEYIKKNKSIHHNSKMQYDQVTR